MKFLQAVLAYILAEGLNKFGLSQSKIIVLFKQTAKRAIFGVLFIIFSILSISLTFIFAAITFFLNFTDQTTYITAGLWTTGTLAIISILLFARGIRFVTKK